MWCLWTRRLPRDQTSYVIILPRSIRSQHLTTSVLVLTLAPFLAAKPIASFMSSPTDSLLASLDKKIHQRTISLSNLRAKRNSVLPVFRLLPEILVIIFIHGARYYYESDHGARFTPCIPTWVNVSYVCSHWRNVALNSPTLWIFHFNVSPRWTEELLLRSRGAPLKISCIYPSRRREKAFWGEGLLDELLKHSERIQEFHLDTLPLFLPDRLSLRLPRLEKLEMNFRWTAHRPSIEITWSNNPLLHTLKLLHCSLPWYSLNLTGLRYLFLCYVQSPSTLNIVGILAVLSGMRNITVLHLEYALPSARGFLVSGGLDVSLKITLPHLSILVVTAPLSTVVALVSCVDIPPSVRLGLGLLLEPGSTVDDFVPIHSFLAQQFGNQTSGPIFRSSFLDTNYFELALGVNEEPPLEEADCNPPLKITLRGVDGDENTDDMVFPDKHRIMGDIFSSLPTRSIHSFHFRWSPYSSDFWREILGRLNGLRYMKVSYGDMPDLSLLALPAPTSNENPDQDPTSNYMFVPALEKLELHHVTFVPDHVSTGMSRKSLFDILSTRKGLRDRLTMTECSLWDGVRI